MMRDSQNSTIQNEMPSPIRDDTISEEKKRPSRNSYYYDDATGYEIYREETEDEEDRDRPDEKSE